MAASDEITLSEDYRCYDRLELTTSAVKTARAYNSLLSGSGQSAPTSDPAPAIATILERLATEAVALPQRPQVHCLTMAELQAEGLHPETSGFVRTETFHRMTIPLSLFPQEGWTFNRIECQISFSTSNPTTEQPVVHSLFPDSEYETLAALSTEVHVGLDANLRFSSDVSPQLGSAMKNSVKIAFAFPLRKYEVQQARVVAAGTGTNRAFWRFLNQQYGQLDHPVVELVLRIPTGTVQLNATGILVAYRELNVWGSDIRVLWKYFTGGVQRWIEAGVPAGSEAHWDLTPYLTNTNI